MQDRGAVSTHCQICLWGQMLWEDLTVWTGFMTEHSLSFVVSLTRVEVISMVSLAYLVPLEGSG